jgi:hypothetical protein
MRVAVISILFLVRLKIYILITTENYPYNYYSYFLTNMIMFNKLNQFHENGVIKYNENTFTAIMQSYLLIKLTLNKRNC